MTPAEYDCPCGVTVRVAAHLSGRKAMCPHCGRAVPTDLLTVDFAFSEEELDRATADVRSSYAPSPETFDPEEEPQGRGFSMPVILMGVVVPLLIAAGFGWYVYASGEQGRFEGAIRRTYGDAVALQYAARLEAAYRKFMAILTAASKREIFGAEARREVEDARARASAIFPLAESEYRLRQAAGGGRGATGEQIVTSLMWMTAVTVVIAIVLTPLILPAVLARRGALDMPRWLAMAGFFFFLAFVFSAPWFFVGGRWLVIVTGSGFFSAWLMEWVPGCFLASALSPRK